MLDRIVAKMADDHAAVLKALTVFPLDGTPKKGPSAHTADQQLAEKARRLVLWSLDEDKAREAVMSALQLATNPYIATTRIMRTLTYKAAQLLLADGEVVSE